MGVDPNVINLEIQQIWATDSEENDYNPVHSHYGLMSGVFYLKVPPQVSEANDEGNFLFHHEGNGFMDVNPLQSIRPKSCIVEVPKTGRFIIPPSISMAGSWINRLNYGYSESSWFNFWFDTWKTESA